ncbi:MAG TPA: DNA-formamidopyrimidine glycosylase [Candidatus Bipolaricaulota bacterium]|nr:DNA-formamidopyrimidine glycosylase [Candidatus Bipolaricaulota bacterium]
MPELPEVEVLKSELSKVLLGKIIRRVEVLDFKKKISPKDLAAKLKNKKISKVWRRQKKLIFDLAGGLSLISHLKMTGQYVFVSKNGKLIFGGHGIPGVEKVPNKFTRVIFNFGNGEELFYNDVRKFGWLNLVDEKALKNILNEVGAEPLSKEFTFEYFSKVLKEFPRKKIKALLLDQNAVAGIGNIYSDEICFAAKVRPDRAVGKLTSKEAKKLFENIKKILSEAIEDKGTSQNNYSRSNKTGEYEKKLKVYGRVGQKCRREGAVLIKMKIAGRTSVFCPVCQK